MEIYEVHLEDLPFFSFHGLYPEERILGNSYRMSVSVSKQVSQEIKDDISKTMDYGLIYQICAQVMADPVDLLETVCQRIAKKIQIQYPDYLTIEISLSKEHPPLGMAGGRSKVRWTVRNE
jgi:dihydroneopterin aldolase